MAEKFTKSMARNIYYGGSFFFLLLLLGLSVDTVRQLPKREHREALTEHVIAGKGLWETNNCIGCHSLMGEGAYYAQSLLTCLIAVVLVTKLRLKVTYVDGLMLNLSLFLNVVRCRNLT